ncbi:hypothetical protein GCM10009794_01860 [Rothia terrae]
MKILTMANEQKSAEIPQSIDEWQGRLDAGADPAIVEEIIGKLKAELAEI